MFVNVGDRWQGHTAISVTFTSDVQYVLFPRDDRGEPAAVHPSSHTALCGLKKEKPKFNRKISTDYAAISMVNAANQNTTLIFFVQDEAKKKSCHDEKGDFNVFGAN